MPDQANALNAVRLFDLMLEIFDGGRRWTQMRIEDEKGRRCLIGAMSHVCLWHPHLNPNDATSYLHRAMPPTPKQMGLTGFNDSRRNYGEVAQLIEDARTLAQRDVERYAADNAAAAQKQQEAEARKRQLLAELERERMVRHAAGDTGATYILSPRAPERRAPELERLAA
jgi:hypothetical protein